MGSIFFRRSHGCRSDYLALACAYQARAEGILVTSILIPDTLSPDIVQTLQTHLGVPNQSHICRGGTDAHRITGGWCHGLVDYVAITGHHPGRSHRRPEAYRGAHPVRHAYETVRRLEWLLHKPIETIPLHAVSPHASLDWELLQFECIDASASTVCDGLLFRRAVATLTAPV